MDKTYNPQSIETKWYQHWEQHNYFAPSGHGRSYCIMIPPPNVTGSLHMGHGFQHAIMDALIRYHRMRGCNTLWQVGTDHAGIATQMVVERQLDAQGINRKQLGREKFVEKVWEWKAESGGTITRQMRRLGNSTDWSRERFTMDEGFYKAVQEVFIRLYDDGLIYRGTRLVNWDPQLHTAVSDLEVISEEEDGYLWHFRYPLSDGSGHLVVATTRPETMLGDTAVAVHPDDDRYRHLIGKTVKLPLAEREIPIIADDYVDKDFGTGCVKITPAHDFNDYDMGQRHNLPIINIFNEDAQLNDNVPAAYRGLDRFVARKKIVADLQALGLVDKIEPHKLKIPRGDRSGVVIEPYLTQQWYVKAKVLAEPAIKAVEDGDIQFVPKNYENMYFSWMRDIQDWCISRQLWWGHRIPAWYDGAGNIYVARSENDARQKYQLDDKIELTQDDDVLDTWFSSGLWTFGTLGWPDDTEALRTFHPTDVLVTGFDIIFFWVARMIMLTMHFRKEIPFRIVYCTGMVRDSHGQKMSKSKGNVLDPIDLIDGIDVDSLIAKRTSGMMVPQLAEKIGKQTRKEFPNGIEAYGTDALRYTFYSLASRSRDINFDVGRIEGFRNFCNKIWNAARYVMMNCEQLDLRAAVELSLADRWITARFQQAVKAVTEGIETYRFDIASQALYEFIWNEYCDWYLELSKPVLWDDGSSAAQKNGTRLTLIKTLESILRLAHPLMPYITEEIWQLVKSTAGVSGATIMQAPFPEVDNDVDATQIDAQAITEIEWVKQFVVGIRNIRGEMQLSPGKSLPVYCANGSEQDRQYLAANRQFVGKLANLESVTVLQTGEEQPLAATALVGDMEILVPLAGLIDLSAEKKRLEKEIGKIESEKSRVDNKLNNSQFVTNAPADVVEKEKKKAAELTAALEKLRSRLQKINALLEE